MPTERLKHTQWDPEGWEEFHPSGFAFLRRQCIAKHTHKIKSASLEVKSSGFDLTKPRIEIFKAEQFGILFLTFYFGTCIFF